MRCKKHYSDLSSINGVCASCLRQRLFSLIAAQSQSQSQSQSHHSDNHPPVFPRSVSPYISRRKSDNSTTSINNRINSDRNRNHSVPDHRFFSTPQVGPPVTDYNNPIKTKKKQHSFIRFSLLSNLFRSKTKKPDSDPGPDPRVSNSNSYSVTNSVTNSTTSAMSSSSPSWFTNMISGTNSRKKQSILSGEIRRQYLPDRGMSPARYSDYSGAEDEFIDRSSGYESCDSRKQTPWLTPSHPTVRRYGGGVNNKNVSGLTFCLSPLVRASPCRKKGISPAVDGGDIRAPVKPHLSNTKSFCANRSRKLADFGRFNNNR